MKKRIFQLTLLLIILKDFNQGVGLTKYLEAENLAEFPAYFYYQPSFMVKIKRIRLGAILSTQSTGSRYSLKDYSGEYLYDTRLKMVAPGFYSGLIIKPDQNIEISLYNEFGYILTDMTISEKLTLNSEEVVNQSEKFKSGNFYDEFGILAAYHLLPVIEIQLNLGYLLQFGKQGMHLSEDPDSILTNPRTNDQVPPDWSGFRIGIGLVANLKSRT